MQLASASPDWSDANLKKQIQAKSEFAWNVTLLTSEAENDPMATVFIPSLMQKLTHGETTVTVEGQSVREIIDNLEEKYPGTKERLVDKFKIKNGITVAVDGEISPIGILEKVDANSEIHFLPAVGGG